jgi:hypothetical protein
MKPSWVEEFDMGFILFEKIFSGAMKSGFKNEGEQFYYRCICDGKSMNYMKWSFVYEAAMSTFGGHHFLEKRRRKETAEELPADPTKRKKKSTSQ